MVLNKVSLKKIFTLLVFSAFFVKYSPSYSQETHLDSSAHATHETVLLTDEAGHAKENAGHGEKKKFNAGEMILEHIGDSHEWHILTFKENHVTIPLPVILLNNGKLEFFMSSKFHHGEHEYTTANGNTYRLNAKGKIESTTGASIIDFSITKNVLSLFVSAIIILWIFISIAGSYTKNKNAAPKGMQSLFEPVIIFIRDEVAKPSIGHNYKRYMPFLLTIFFFIWINNMLGLIPMIPFGANITGNIAVTMTLALCTFIISLAISNKSYWAHIFTPDVPKGLYVLLVPIEILGVILKPFVLTLRLFANMLAGHIIPLAFISLIFIFAEMSAVAGYSVSVVSVFLSLFMSVLELLVCFLQAYVFTLLSAMYFGMAIEEHHDAAH
jgi:F-type H+-transporting ATPase subunit a